MESLRDRTILVTGAGGFIGSALTERLVQEGARVRAFVRYNSRGAAGWIDAFDPDVRAQLTIVSGDLKDPVAVRRAVDGCEVVFHLGALVAIPYSYIHPLDFVQTNVVGTAHVLDACHATGVRRLVNTSTSEVYGSASSVPIGETHPLVGQSPYAASKIAADQLAESYHRSFDLPVVTVRPFNTYGPRQSARAVVPAIASQCLASRNVKLGSLHPTRDLTYVDDTVDGFVRAATAKDAIGQVVNLGSGREISIGDLADTLVRVCGGKSMIERDDQRVRPSGSEVDRLCADNDRARRLLGWEPRVALDDGLVRTVTWLDSHLSLYRPDEYSV